jgi:hypothetical protein
MVILRATSILGGQKEDKGMIYSITHTIETNEGKVPVYAPPPKPSGNRAIFSIGIPPE